MGFPDWGAGGVQSACQICSGVEGNARGWNNSMPLFADLAFSVNTSYFQDISSVITKPGSIFSAIAEKV